MVYHYPTMIPPSNIEYSEMNKKQAQEHFDWFMKEIPTRIKILFGAIEASGIRNIERFDMTPQSLNLLWTWLKERIRTVPTSQEEMNALKKNIAKFDI
ncbi:hypothetical protein J2Z69_001815 [Paenibacillus shirakamiensis]|uniref:Uncharacterized protein n=1 Tax=Paenibacillus shirakamiensis TaxID=1265935 RepID=A0ABS4JGE2_9BACL|nr:hypothetical protein [Paenibacillus shirakamiensis]MBP2000784.1 hypothetical protein [Paenibacillus shirakamiensis]